MDGMFDHDHDGILSGSERMERDHFLSGMMEEGDDPDSGSVYHSSGAPGVYGQAPGGAGARKSRTIGESGRSGISPSQDTSGQGSGTGWKIAFFLMLIAGFGVLFTIPALGIILIIMALAGLLIG